jgi:hypothetical protein
MSPSFRLGNDGGGTRAPSYQGSWIQGEKQGGRKKLRGEGNHHHTTGITRTPLLKKKIISRFWVPAGKSTLPSSHIAFISHPPTIALMSLRPPRRRGATIPSRPPCAGPDDSSCPLGWPRGIEGRTMDLAGFSSPANFGIWWPLGWKFCCPLVLGEKAVSPAPGDWPLEGSRTPGSRAHCDSWATLAHWVLRKLIKSVFLHSTEHEEESCFPPRK